MNGLPKASGKPELPVVEGMYNGAGGGGDDSGGIGGAAICSWADGRQFLAVLMVRNEVLKPFLLKF